MRISAAIATLLLSAACASQSPLEPTRSAVPDQALAKVDANVGKTPAPRMFVCRGGTLLHPEPLMVINGVVVVVDSALARLDPSLVDSITVLKGSAATQLFGSRASNGLVQIYTRQLDWQTRR